MKKVTIIAKTNLNNDGRILNQIKILKDYYKKDIFIDLVLLSDALLKIELGCNVKVHNVETIFRNSSLFRLFTVIEFTLKSLFLLLKLKPHIVHAQDSAIVIPVYLYHLLYGKFFKLIYDDHELPNENEPIQNRFLQFFEVKLIKRADMVIFANRERMQVVQEKYLLDLEKSTYFLNLPYFTEEKGADLNSPYKLLLEDVKQSKLEGTKFIIHQGPLNVQRGRLKLAEFAHKLPENIKILLLGLSIQDFKDFVDEYSLDIYKFCFIGSIPYSALNDFWKLADAAIVMYLPTYINNKLCAPNRFYIAIENQLPVLINQDNPVLRNFINQHNVGFYIEDIRDNRDVQKVIEYRYEFHLMEALKNIESSKLIRIYENLES